MLSQAHFTESPNGILNGLRHLTYSSPIYNYTLIGRMPTRLLGTPPELIPGNASDGQAFLTGILRFRGRRNSFSSFDTLPGHMNEDCLAYLHGFNWLADLRQIGSQRARNRVQVLITEWISLYGQWDSLSWRPDVLGARLANWTTHFAFFTADADRKFIEGVFSELGRQSRHLSRSVLHSERGRQRIVALKGLIYAGIALPESDRYLIQGLGHLEFEISHQIYPDGGHISRNPTLLMHIMTNLIEIRETLSAAHIKVPAWLQLTIDRMAPMLRAMRLGDGGLALFNEGIIGEAETIEALLSKANRRKKVLRAAPHSGFHRLAAGKTVLILDAGAPPKLEANKWGHAGGLSFEMSVGKERLIVNCGTARHLGEAWHQVLRTTAAHSTMTVDDVNSAELHRLGGFKRIPSNVYCSRREIDGKTVIEASTDGYGKPFDLIHRRILMMSPNGAAVIGEDQLSGTGGRKYSLRFHLHPNVKATLIQHGKAALLKPRRGPAWKLAVPSGNLKLEDSVYLDGPVRLRRSQQVVVSGRIFGRGATVKWRVHSI